jgi:hypothetical protein
MKQRGVRGSDWPIPPNTETEFVTDRQWDGQARRIFKKNIRDHGQSLSESAITRRANSYIIEIMPDKKVWS